MYHVHQDEDHGEAFQSNLLKDQNCPVQKITIKTENETWS